jgi:hypothetical protein
MQAKLTAIVNYLVTHRAQLSAAVALGAGLLEIIQKSS